MISKQEQFEKKTIERLYGFVDSDYKLYDTYGRYAKPDMLSMVALSKQVSIKDNTYFLAILDLIEKYCACDPADPQTLHTEEELLKAIVQTQDDFVIEAEKNLEVLQQKSSRIFSNVSIEEKKDIDVRKKDLQYVIAQANATGMLNMAACAKMYFDGLMYGLLPAEPLPDTDTEESTDAGLEASEVPIFVHEPISQDIPADKTGPFFDGLRTLAETDALFIKGMMRDCDNGKVYVRLYDPYDDYNQIYLEIEKFDAYYEWVITEGGSSNWPGYIIAALEAKGLSTDSDPEEIFSYILGSYMDEIDISDYCTFSEEKIVVPDNSDRAKALTGYKNCGLLLCASLLTTDSNMIEDAEQYIHLRDALEEFTACFSLSTADKQTRDAAMELLKQHSDSFRSQTLPGSRRMRKRILVCDVIDTLYELYVDQPEENPYKIIRKLYPQLWS